MKSAPPLRYRLLIVVLSPAIMVLVLWQAWRNRQPRFARQRLGYGYPRSDSSTVWLHCASVGELRAALPLINRLRKDPLFSPLLVSTATTTGGETLLQQKWQDVTHVYLPIDTVYAVKRAFKALRPRALILMETEIWPELICRARSHDIPIAVVNARMSQRTLNAPRWLQPVYRHTLTRVNTVLAKSTNDAEAFQQMGANPKAVYMVGNLKFAAVTAALQPCANVIGRPFWLAASTHDDEEYQLCKALLTLPDLSRDFLLVIAPRHPHRSAKIQRQINSLGLTIAVRSLKQPIDTQTKVYLADTLGEMPVWLQHAKVVFMGGSLVPVGGHNFLEPAAAGVPIISGPHVHNFKEESELLTPSGALQIASDVTNALELVQARLRHPAETAIAAEQGRMAVAGKAQILEDYITRLSSLVSHQ